MNSLQILWVVTLFVATLSFYTFIYCIIAYRRLMKNSSFLIELENYYQINKLENIKTMQEVSHLLLADDIDKEVAKNIRNELDTYINKINKVGKWKK